MARPLSSDSARYAPNFDSSGDLWYAKNPDTFGADQYAESRHFMGGLFTFRVGARPNVNILTLHRRPVGAGNAFCAVRP